MDQIGRYKIEAEIGHGGFGRVYRAFDPNFSRHVAIKVLSAGADKDLLTRFRNEAIAVGKLQHKNIVIVHDFGEIGDTPYLVMEYLEGHDLQKALRSRRPMNLLDKVTIMDQVAAGLHHAHRNGIVHRDVKPANVMILKDGSVKIMDFGIARLVQDRGTRVTQHGNVIGTVQYMAPEQFRGGDVDSRCDVFAYGVIYYELITGHHPFDAPDMPRIFYNVTMVDPSPVRSLAPECPAALEEIITKTLQKDPEFRYQTLEDVLFDVAPIRLTLERDFGQSLVRKAERLFSESNVAEAQQVIREALQFDPNNSDARHIRERIQRHAERVAGRERARHLVEAGRRDVVNRDFDRALEQFESARRVDTDNPEIEQLIASVRREMEKAERAAMLLVKARNEFEARDITGAYQDVLECLQCQPDSAEAHALLGSIRREIERRERERRFAEAISRVEFHLGAGEYEQALTLLGDLDVSYPGTSKVQELIRSATEAKQEKERKERIALALDRARKLVSEANWREAVGVLERVQKEQKPELAVQSLLAYCREELTAQEKAAEVESAIREARKLSDAFDFDNAISRIDRSLAKYPDEPTLRAAHDRTAAAKRTYERNQAISAARSRAAEHVAAKQYGKAITLLDEAIVNWSARELIELKEQTEKQWRDHQRNELVMATIADSTKLLESGRSEEAATVLRRVLATYPGEAQVTKFLAEIEARIAEEKRQARIGAVQGEIEALRRQGRYDQAISAADTAVREFGREEFRRLRDELQEQLEEQRRRQGIDAACADAERYSKSGDLQQAITCLEGAADTYGRDSRLESALSEYRDRLSKQQRAAAVQSIVNSATSLLRRDDFQPALKLIREGLDNYPEEPALSTLMSRATAEQGEFNRRRGIKVALDRVRELKQKRQFEQAEEALQRALRTLTNEPELLAELEVVRRLGSAERAIAEAQRLLTNGDIAGARASIERAAANAADDARVHALQEQIRSAADEQERRERIAKTLAEARALSESDKAEAALALLQRALDRDPQEAQLRSFKAYVEETVKAQQRERDIADRIHAGRELVQSGSHREAIRVLEAALRVYPDEPALSGLLVRAREQHAAEKQADIARSHASADAARARGDFETALALVNSALQLHPNESSLFVLQQRTLEERATAEQEQSAELKRTTIDTALASSDREASRGKHAAALQILDGALKQYPADPVLTARKESIEADQREHEIEAALRQANEHVKNGKHDAGIKLLETNLRNYPDNRLTAALADARHQKAELERRNAAAAAARNAEAALKRNDPDSALKIVSAALIDAPGDAALLQAKSHIESALVAQSRRRDAAALNPAEAQAINGAPVAERIETPAPAPPDVSRPPVRVSPEPKPAGSRNLVWLGGGLAVAALVVAFVMMRPKTTEVPPPGPEPVPPKPSVLPPKVLRFEANRTTAAAGQPVEICYGVENVKSLRLDPPIQAIEPAASRCFSFAPKTAGEYTLIAVGNNGEEISQKFRIDISDAPPVKPGTLVVQVAEGTTVTISGRRYVADRTNSVTVPLERGQYTVGAEREGYAALPPRLVRIEPERTEKLAFTLTPMPATLSIAGMPSGTTVAVDNRPVGTIQGTGSFPIQPGKHSVLLTSNGFQPKRVDIDAQPGATVTLGPPAVSMVRTEPVPPPVDPVVAVRQRWEQLQSSRDINVLEEFRRSNPGQYGDNAARRIEQLEWETARTAKNVAPVRAFLAKYPSSSYSDEAKQMLQQLEWAAVDRNDVNALRAYVQRVPNGPFTQQAIAEIKRLEAGERSAGDRRAVAETLNRLEASYSAKDYKQLTDIWPGAPRSLRDTFKDAQSITVNLTPVGAAEVSGDTAVVVCQRSVQTNFPGKKLPPVNDRVTVRLQRSSSGWQVMTIQ